MENSRGSFTVLCTTSSQLRLATNWDLSGPGIATERIREGSKGSAPEDKLVAHIAVRVLWRRRALGLGDAQA